ncbi:MAG: hypothetical protein ACI4OU_05135 [Candidatus Enterenecus sp.]
MKKSAALLVALFLLLAGCGQPAVTPSPTVTPTETVEPAPALTLMEGREPAGELGNAWYLPCDAAEAMDSPELYPFGERALLLVSNVIGESGCRAELKLLSLEDGSLLAENSFSSSGYVSVQVGEGVIGLCDSGAGTVRVLDGSLTPVRTYEPEGDGEGWYLSGDMETLYILRFDRGLFARDLESGTETALLDNAARVYAFGEPTWFVLFSYVDLADERTYCGSLNLDTGAVEPAPTETAANGGCRVGETWLLNDAARWGEYRILADGRTMRASWAGSRFLLTEPGGLLLTVDGTGRELTLYEPDGRFLSRCLLPQGEDRWVGGDFVWSGLWNGYFFLDYENSRNGRLMFWDTRAETRGEDFPMEEGEEPVPGGALALAELYDRAAELSRRFGVDIRIADQCALEYTGYTAYAVSDGEALGSALDTLERALSAYPEGFLEQLKYGGIRSIRIELVGGLSPREDAPESITAAAFTQEQGDCWLMVADVYMTGEGAVYHELSHIIDGRLAWDAGLREEALFSEEDWLALQPAGFQYAWSYRNIPDSVTEYYGSGYFVLDYSCTFPTEDRATLMEAAMTGAGYEFEGSPALLAKLEYYCRCIRDCFDTAGWPALTAWEGPLGE